MGPPPVPPVAAAGPACLCLASPPLLERRGPARPAGPQWGPAGGGWKEPLGSLLLQRESVGRQVQTVGAVGFVAHAFTAFPLSSERNRDLSSKHRPCLKSRSREMSGALAARSQTRGTHDPFLLGNPHFCSCRKNPILHSCSGRPALELPERGSHAPLV